jgi:hypothetical protein
MFRIAWFFRKWGQHCDVDHSTSHFLSNQFLSSGRLDVEATVLPYRQCMCFCQFWCNTKVSKPYASFKGQQHIQKTDPSSHQRGRPTRTRPKLPHNNNYLVMGPRWSSTQRLTDWLTVSRNVTLTLTLDRLIFFSSSALRVQNSYILLADHSVCMRII